MSLKKTEQYIPCLGRVLIFCSKLVKNAKMCQNVAKCGNNLSVHQLPGVLRIYPGIRAYFLRLGVE